MKQKNDKNIRKFDPPTTGHSWDGIEEFDNPDPFWLRIMFYIMLFIAIIYWFLYPSFPSQQDSGLLNWSEYNEVKSDLKDIQSVRSRYQLEFDNSSFEEILKNPKLLKFAINGGRSAFNNNCAVCHMTGGVGQPGYPNLAAGMWLWGGKPEDIYTTLLHGIRANDDDTRQSLMAAFGKDGILTISQINQLVDYVINLHAGKPNTPESDKLFQDNCAACHGSKGEGGREFGAPRLNTPIWLYGSDRKVVFDVIYNGRGGVMPNWSGRLDNSTLRQLTIYVHQLGAGE